MITVDLRMDFRDVEIGILGAFPTFNDHRRANQLEIGGIGRKISLDLPRQIRLRLGQRFVQHYQCFMGKLAIGGLQHIFQNGVERFEDMLREMHPELVTDLDRTLNQRHGS